MHIYGEPTHNLVFYINSVTVENVGNMFFLQIFHKCFCLINYKCNNVLCKFILLLLTRVFDFANVKQHFVFEITVYFTMCCVLLC